MASIRQNEALLDISVQFCLTSCLVANDLASSLQADRSRIRVSRIQIFALMQGRRYLLLSLQNMSPIVRGIASFQFASLP
jgi:hypothetical protein